MAVHGGTITILSNEEERVIPAEAIAKVEIRRLDGSVGVVGALPGAGAGYLVGTFNEGDDGPPQFARLIGAISALPGAILGGRAGSHGWEAIALEHVRVEIAAQPGPEVAGDAADHEQADVLGNDRLRQPRSVDTPKE